MSATSSRSSSGRFSRNAAIDLAVFTFCVAMLVAMATSPGEETIPYHLLFLCVTIVYGFRVWPLLPTLAILVIITVATGWVMVTHYLHGSIDRQELAEVVLMPMLVGAMVWHARRRADAQWQVQRMADERTTLLERLRDFFRDTSHAIRTPVTIARGHMELVSAAVALPDTREDVEVALRQLTRMSRLSDRLLTLAQLDSGLALAPRPVALRAFVEELGRNWAAASERRWRMECWGDGCLLLDPEMVALALDALVENAVHHTYDGDRIDLIARLERDRLTFSVVDDGPGIAPAAMDHIFERFWHTEPPNGPMGSGLGLAMVAATAKACGGLTRARNVPGRGARFDIELAVARALSDSRMTVRS
jgi:signal transduction histidine kinase